MHDPTKFQTFTLVRKKHSRIFVDSDLKCPFIKFSINNIYIYIHIYLKNKKTKHINFVIKSKKTSNKNQGQQLI